MSLRGVRNFLAAKQPLDKAGGCLDFALFSRRDDGSRRSNRVGEDDDLKQKKQTKQVRISQLIKFIS